MTAVIELTAAQKLAQEVHHLVGQGDKGAALLAAKRGWRDFPEWTAQTPNGPISFERLTVILSAATGGVAEPAEPEGQVQAAAPVSAPVAAPVAAPVSVAPVSVAPAVVPVSPAAPSGALTAALVIERSEGDGTIIVPPKGAPKLNDVLKPLGWNWAKRGFYYLGDRDTAPNMAKIQQTLEALVQAGLLASSTVTGAESARPVSAVPVRPVSAAPVARRAAAPTRRERGRKASPVEVRYVAPASPAAPVAPTYQAAPVSAAPAVPAAPVSAEVAAMMQQLASLTATVQALVAGQAAPVAAPVAAVAPVSAVPVSPATASSLEETLGGLMDAKQAEQLAKVEALAWQFRLASGAHARHTARELRSKLSAEVVTWWAHHHAGSVSFSVMVDKDTPGVLHVKVSVAAGEITPTKLSEQVVGTALTVKGIWSRSTTKRDA